MCIASRPPFFQPRTLPAVFVYIEIGASINSRQSIPDDGSLFSNTPNQLDLVHGSSSDKNSSPNCPAGSTNGLSAQVIRGNSNRPYVPLAICSSIPKDAYSMPGQFFAVLLFENLLH